MDIKSAVDIWYPSQDQELALGNAGAAHAIFAPLDPAGLDSKTATRLKLIQNRLHLMYGESEEVLANMNAYSWHVEEELDVIALEQQADAFQMKGDLRLSASPLWHGFGIA